MRMPISAPEAGIRGSIGAMHITFKLYAGLTDYLPAEHRTGNLMPLEVAPGATIAQIIEPFHMPEKLVKLVLVNGVYAVSYTHLRAHETVLDLVCRLLLEKKKNT